MTAITDIAAHDDDALPGSDTVVLHTRRLRPGTDTAALSRFGDERWHLTPALFAPHADGTSISFASVHGDFLVPLKHVYWAMINHSGEQAVVNRHHGGVPAILTISTMFRFSRAFTDWLVSRGCRSFAAVTANDLDDYLVHVKTAETTHANREDLLAAVIKIWAYRALVPEADRLPSAPPWNGERVYRLLEASRRQEIRTPRIHPDTMNSLLAWSLQFVEEFADDITAGFHEYERLHRRMLPTRKRPNRVRRKPGDLADDLQTLLRAYSRLARPLPGIRSRNGELTYHLSYLARLLDTSHEALQRPGLTDMLRRSGLTIREGAALLIPITGTLNGQPWRDQPIDEREAHRLARHLSAACFVVIGYLSGMRTGEILTLERGCLQRDPVSNLLLVRGRHWKGVRDETGSSVAEGRIRPDPWVVAEPVATAIGVLENLHHEQLLFPHMLGEHKSGPREFRTGQARTTGGINVDIADMIGWVNTYCAATGRGDSIPPDPTDPNIPARRLRRTLAWFIARKPRGLVAAAIQYGHLKVQMTVGYAGSYASGFPDDLAFEEWLARLDLLASANERLDEGEYVSGPAAATYRHRVDAAQRFAGHVLRTTSDARTLLANPDLQIYPGHGMTCVFDPRRAACHLSRDDTDTRRTPDLSDCRPNCVNIARTDRDIDELATDVERLRLLVDDPLAPPIRVVRDRHELHRLEDTVAQHIQWKAEADG
ncbi:hypothetical protein [Antrihabitans cavernicola]|nr:hypothetical protein [Spelaeibacter cavernicola]